MKLVVCPLCITRVAIGKDNCCPACRRDVTDTEAVRREERIDEIYRLLWKLHQDGKSLRAALETVRCDPTLHRGEIDEAAEALLREGKRTFLESGWRDVTYGILALVGGLGATLITYITPLPFVFVFYGAVAYGLVALLFGLSQLLKYWRCFAFSSIGR